MARDEQSLFWKNYHVRMLACSALSLLLLTAAFRLWPTATAPPPLDRIYDARGAEVIELEEIQPTSQAQSTPPPPAPLPPVVVPDDEILDEIELDVADNFFALDVTREAPPAPPGPQASTGRQSADVAPKPVRFVEPEYTREARRRRVRAEVVVEVLVDERGQVRETKIVERFLLGKSEQDRTPVTALGYGLEEAALAAAERWIFRPARQNGQAVQSYTTLTFSFGV